MNTGIQEFNGERLDPLSGYTHLGNGYRAYNSNLMRFHSPDGWSPFGEGGINTYVYCTGDPMNQADPSGHFSPGQWIGMGVGLLAGIALSIVTDGAAMPALFSLMATVAGDATVGAGSELITEAVDGQRIHWGRVSIAAGLSAAATLAGAGLGMASKLKGTSNRPIGGWMADRDAFATASGSGSGIWRSIGERFSFLQRRAKFSEGSEAILYKKGNMLIKEYRNPYVGLSHLENETAIFNKIYATDRARVKPPRSIYMPVVEGVPLSHRDILAELTGDNAHSLIASMDRIHNMGVLHGDISDGNILFRKATSEFNFIDFSASSSNSSGLERRAEANHLRWKIQQWPKYSDEWGL